jgi:hypothetical protein
MIFNDGNWVYTKWQWSVNLYNSGKETSIYKTGTIHKRITKHRITKIENNIPKKKENIQRMSKHLSKLLQRYLPIEREVINCSSVRPPITWIFSTCLSVLSVLIVSCNAAEE